MQSTPWQNLLKKVPQSEMQRLMLRTLGATELMIQSIISMDGECLIFRGRLAGTQDNGRVFFVPYDQIDFLSTVNVIKEEDLAGWFGSSVNGAEPASNATPEETPAANGSTNGAQRLSERQSVLLSKVRARARNSDESN